LRVPDEGDSLRVPDEGDSLRVPDEDDSLRVPDEGDSLRVPDEDDSLVIDPWQRTVYTKQEILLVNSPANFYGLNDRMQGKTEIKVQSCVISVSLLIRF
jgi:hypothetical protein